MAVSQFHMFYHYTVHIINILTICKTVFHQNTRNEHILTRNDTLCVLYNVRQKAASECHWKSETQKQLFLNM